MTIKKQVILQALRDCRDIYAHDDDVMINRDWDGYTILSIEGTSYKSFMTDVQSAKDRLKKKVEDRKKKDAQFVDTKTKGVRFYDKKGKGRIVKGRKIYD